MANTMSTTGSRSTTPTTPTRFYPALDIALLKEVLAVNPYESDKNTNEWESIVANVNSTLPDYKNVTLRSCKDRLKTLIKAHQKAEMQSLKASGTAEEYTEREALLTEVSNLITEAARVKEVKKDTDNKDQQGKEIREAAMLSLKRPGDKTADDTYDVKRRKKSGAGIAEYLELMKDKQAKEAELKLEQMRLDQEKFKLEKREREQRMERDATMLELIKKLISDKN